MSVYVADMGSQNTVDFARLAHTPCVGVIHRATRSNEQTDPLYHKRKDLALGVGLKWGAYAFNTGESVVTQTSRFLAFVDPEPDTSCWLDLERNPGGTGQMTLAMVIEFLDRLDQAIGRRCGLYSGDVIKTLLGGGLSSGTASDREFLAAHPLWGCEYGPRWKNVDTSGNPLPWPKPFLWQYTGDDIGPPPNTLDGLERGADLSVFDGTADQLRAAWALPSITPAAVA
jgi:GH25 family lysozyme M1 (1,4-beta-N-acetylmuramidase)